MSAIIIPVIIMESGVLSVAILPIGLEIISGIGSLAKYMIKPRNTDIMAG